MPVRGKKMPKILVKMADVCTFSPFLPAGVLAYLGIYKNYGFISTEEVCLQLQFAYGQWLWKSVPRNSFRN